MSIFDHRSADPMGGSGSADRGFSHPGLLYHGATEFIDIVNDFVLEGLAAGVPVMVAVPGKKSDLLQATLKVAGAHFVDMTELGRNPARIIPAIREFQGDYGSGPIRFVGESIWFGRNVAEIGEAVRHEALINVAFQDCPVTVLCPYDAEVLPRYVIKEAWRIHPLVIEGGVARPSEAYADPESVYADAAWPLEESPGDAEVREFRTDMDLTRMRALVQQFGWAANLPVERVDDLVLAVSEVASNSVQHGGGAGSLTMWCDDRSAVIAEIQDSGEITDPLVGRYPPGPGLEVKGLWLVNQLCDLVQIRSGPSGTCTRLTISS
jgi:anti-sigma regulatory factor (Ser/Thr protein kinase)